MTNLAEAEELGGQTAQFRWFSIWPEPEVGERRTHLQASSCSLLLGFHTGCAYLSHSTMGFVWFVDRNCYISHGCCKWVKVARGWQRRRGLPKVFFPQKTFLCAMAVDFGWRLTRWPNVKGFIPALNERHQLSGVFFVWLVSFCLLSLFLFLCFVLFSFVLFFLFNL